MGAQGLGAIALTPVEARSPPDARGGLSGANERRTISTVVGGYPNQGLALRRNAP